MKYTLLELTQTILSSIDANEINSIFDSVESQQVATIIRSVYFDIKDRANLPEHYSLVNLTPTTDSSKPVIMTLPSTVSKIEWVKYNKETSDDERINMELVTYLPLEDFLQRMYRLNEDENEVETFEHDLSGSIFNILYLNNKAPDYYTTFDDRTLVFDSYDNEVDATLQSAKSLCYARKIIPFDLTNTFIPDLDEEQFSLLLNEAKAMAWLELRQTPHPKAERNALRGWTGVMKRRYSTETESDFDRLPYFGRK